MKIDHGNAAASPSAFGELVDLLDELTGALDDATVDLPIPNRPGWSLRCTARVTAEQQRKWARAAQSPDWRAGDLDALRIDLTKVAALAIADLCEVIVRDGEPYLDGDGRPVHFRSSYLYQGAKTPQSDKVRQVFGNDMHVREAFEALLEEAAKPVPSRTSSTS